MKQDKKITSKTSMIETSDFKTLADWPPNIRRFNSNKGALFIAVDQSGRAIAMTFVPN